MNPIPPRKQGYMPVTRRLELQTNRRRKSSRYLGVSFHRRKRVWVAFVIIDGRQHHVISQPPTRAGEIEAARARDEALLYHGITRGLNFPL